MQPIRTFYATPFIQAAEILLASDETLKALELLENLPSYYIDHPVKEIEELKKEIRAKIATSNFYTHHRGCEADFTDEQVLACAGTLRNILIKLDVKVLNEKGLVPYIFDYGPGEGVLPAILNADGLKFNYEQIYLNIPTREATLHRFKEFFSERKEDQPTIFVATEIIEHLYDEREIRYEIDRRCLPDVVHISTPLYTFNFAVSNWREIGMLGHLRTYSPKTFRDTVTKLFPEYAMGYYQSQIQHARLVNPSSKHECLKTHYEITSKDQA